MPTRRPFGRVAVLSLQRLGDLVTASRVCGHLARDPQVSTVELIHFSETTGAAALLAPHTVGHALPYNELKQARHIHALAGYARLTRRLSEIIGSRPFDCAVVLTATPFACRLAPTLVEHADPYHLFGPWIDAAEQAQVHSPMMHYLQDWGVERQLNVFAHQDLLAAMVGCSPGPSRLSPNLSGWMASQAFDWFRRPLDETLVIHPLSSDPSKDWFEGEHPVNWTAIANELATRGIREVLILGAPNQREKLGQLAQAWPLRHTIVTDDLATCTEVLRACAGLISVDTVSIHLAARVGCKSVVLRRGPALGTAFLPGENTLLIDALTEDPAFAGDFPAKHVVDAMVMHLRAASTVKPAANDGPVLEPKGFCLRMCQHDTQGLRETAVPPWLHASPDTHAKVANENLWRRLWWTSWSNEIAVDPAWLDRAEEAAQQGALAAERLARARASSTALGRLLNQRPQGRAQVA